MAVPATVTNRRTTPAPPTAAAGKSRLLRVLLLLAAAGGAAGVCVLDNKRGWWLDCGLRDSYLFRIKDFGGITARFDFALGLGDENGFPHSIANTNKGGSAPYSHEELPPPLIPPFSKGKLYSRASDGGQSMAGDRLPSPLERRSSHGIPFPLNMFIPTSGEKRPSSPKKGSQRPVYRQFRPPQGGGSPPPIIPAGDNRGVWVKVPHVGERSAYVPPYSPEAPRSYKHLRKPQTSQRVHHGPDLLKDFRESPGLEWHVEDSWPQRESSWPPRESLRPPRDHRESLWPREHEYEDSRLASMTLEGLQSQFSDFRSPPPLEKPPPEPYTGPIIGTVLGEVLQKPGTTPADSDHVPSFAAQLLVVRDAPDSLHPPGYNSSSPHFSLSTKLPRTKFFCEEQEFLPGLYADAQLGCKIFHLCVPAALGSTIQSFLCPNSTLFDQSILQCNYWQLVDCSQSSRHYDANQPLALSYRRVNAAYLPVDHVHDPLTLSLLSDIRPSS